ncbi:MAG: glutaredoxin family protein [Burkholderiaceae bacterium]|nr:glutaredoxin family protein [Burkholderiaceae bacterium]
MPLLHPLRPWSMALCLGLCAGAALAQPVYRVVGPDGKVTFSDRAPSLDTPAVGSGNATAGAGAASSLPFGLQQIASRFPVTLYTGSDCAPCASARSFLVQRGVPFTERTVSSNEDITALQRLSGSASLPFGTIGSQQLQGFSDVEWTQFLDAAGYPKQSQLPASYRRPPATPLVTVQQVQPPSRASAPVQPSNDLPPSGPAPSNPAGIRF